MAQPVLVHSYTSPKRTPCGSPGGRSDVLPPISAFSFADILRSADSTDLQAAIDGIAEICAKNRMSLAEEYGSHLPPVGEIIAVSTESAPLRHQQQQQQQQQQHGRLNMRRALTSVPEVSSGSSDGSAKARSRRILGFGPKQEVSRKAMRRIRISSTGKTIPVCGTTAVSVSDPDIDTTFFSGLLHADIRPTPNLPTSPGCEAASSLRLLVAAYQSRSTNIC